MCQRRSLRRQDRESPLQVQWRRRQQMSSTGNKRQDKCRSSHEVEHAVDAEARHEDAPMSGPSTEPKPLTRMRRPLTATTRSAGIRSCAWATQTG